MFVIVAFAVGLLVYTAIMMAVAPIQDTYVRQRSQIIYNDVASVLEAMTEYHGGRSGGYPTLDQLVSTPGYEYLRTRELARLQSSRATGITDSVWRFSRVAVWFESPYKYVGNTVYLSASQNTCGNGAFGTAISWCGRTESIWGKVEDKGSFSSLIFAEKNRLSRTMSKFYKRYNKDRTFSPLSNGSSRTLASLVGYTGTAAACSQVFVYNEIPLDCHDLFNFWGVPVVFHKIGDLHIALGNRTEVFDGSGNPVRLLEEARLEHT
ncbi:hypothetical protein [Stutzerimonas stutzeri]|uniref:hypothetical protein n=1 Tax=Stutzerimonas stutzeri TaxID=316 RepID=UPI00265D1F68|nr:hypothetical protein [Stutzerimonas stutzeri]MCF6783439.1 hypothetical protein [Stutzerimonas stutzeri]